MTSRRNKTSQQNSSGGSKQSLGKIMNCICSAEQLQAADDIRPSSESLATRDYMVSASHSSRTGDVNKQPPDTRNIEEAESTLRESGSLNYEVGFLSLIDLYLHIKCFICCVVDSST